MGKEEEGNSSVSARLDILSQTTLEVYIYA
jgi:hypothetical protein